MSTKRRMIVIGCGPAGLLAAHAGVLQGWEVIIFSKKQKSQISGAQYLQSEIPLLATYDMELFVTYCKVGQKRNYARRVYGSMDAPVSWGRYQSGVPYKAFSLHKAYDALWNMYEGLIIDQNISWEWLKNIWQYEAEFVVSTIPLITYCGDPQAWEWNSQEIYVLGGEQDDADPRNGYVMYNGSNLQLQLESETPYRVSCIGGVYQEEYSFWVPRSVKVVKPLSTNWTLPASLGVDLLVGRYGAWNKEELAHDAYWKTEKKLLELR